MIKRINTYIILLILVLLTNCQNKVKDTVLYSKYNDLFDKAIPVKGKHLKEQYLSPSSFKCFYLDSAFLGSMPLPNKNIVHLVDLCSGEVTASAIKNGRGPGEILSSLPYVDYLNGWLYVGDIATNRIKRVAVKGEKLVTEDFVTIKYSNPTITAGMEVLSDSLLAIFGYCKNSQNIYLVDKTGIVLDSIKYSLLNDQKIDDSKVSPYYISMSYHSSNHRLYVYNKTYNHIRIYNIIHNTIELISHFNLTEPKYMIKSGKPIQSGKNITLSGEIFLGKDYVYLVANPELRSDFEKRREDAYSKGITLTAVPDTNSYILIFDYNFNLLKSYLCDSNFSWIALTEDASIVYASDKRNHCLTKYILEGLE